MAGNDGVAGRNQLVGLIAGSAIVLEGRHVMLSILSARLFGLVLILNHKPGRYVGF